MQVAGQTGLKFRFTKADSDEEVARRCAEHFSQGEGPDTEIGHVASAHETFAELSQEFVGLGVVGVCACGAVGTTPDREDVLLLPNAFRKDIHARIGAADRAQRDAAIEWI